MRHINGHARVFASLLVGLGAAVGVVGDAAADAPAGATIVLDTMVKEVRAPSNSLKVTKDRGTGSMDPTITQISKTKLLIADTASTTPNGNNGIIGTLTLIELTKNGPQIVSQLSMPREDGNRVHMKMNIVPLDFQANSQMAATSTAALNATGKVRALITYATEDNNGDPGADGADGSNNGNPQTVGWVAEFDAAPATTFSAVALTNNLNTKGSRTGPGVTLLHKTNMVSLTGDNDAQQYGAENVTCNGALCTIAMQRNNATTNIAAFKINPDGTMTQTVARTTNNQNGQHCRPVFATDFAGRQFEAIVETNNQPARNIKLWENAPATTAAGGTVGPTGTIKTQRIMQGIAGNGQQGPTSTALYVSRAYAGTVRQLSDALSPAAKAALQTTSPVFTFAGVVAPVRNRDAVGGNNQDGHGGGATRSMLMALNPNTFQPLDAPAGAVAVGKTPAGMPTLDKLPLNDAVPGAVRINAANFGRHASMITANAFGPAGAALPAAVILSAPSTGATSGYAQFIPYDPVTQKFDVRANKNRFALGFADLTNQVKGKNNPNNQGGSFMGGVTDVANPFYHDVTAKQPEVRSYTIVPVTGAFNITGANADTSMGLRISMIPQTWDPAVVVVPGNPKDPNDVPNGPSPVAPTSVPGGGGAGQPGGDAPGSAGTGAGTGDGTNGSFGDSGLGGSSSGCSVGATSSTNVGGLALLGLGLLGLVVRRNKKEQS